MPTNTTALDTSPLNSTSGGGATDEFGEFIVAAEFQVSEAQFAIDFATGATITPAESVVVYQAIEVLAELIALSSDAQTSRPLEFIDDTFQLTLNSEITRSVIAEVSSTMTDATLTQLQCVMEVAQDILTHDTAGAVTEINASDTVTASGDFLLSYGVAAAEALVAAGVFETSLRAINSLASAITVAAQLHNTHVAISDETINVAATLAALMHAKAEAADTVTLTEGAENTLFLVSEDAESMEVDTASELFQHLIYEAEDSLDFAVVLRMGDEVYAAWVLNPATQGVSRYEDYPFNSMAEYGGVYYGVADDGVYLLDGDTDDGAAISASLKTGLFRFGRAQAKRMADVFIGVTAAGDMVLKVQSDENGVRTERWYEVIDRGDASNHRVKLGRGAKSPYWGFELVNVNGADFELDNIQLHPMTLTRKV